MIVNRVGDISLIAALGLSLFLIGDLNLPISLTNVNLLSTDLVLVSLVGLLFLFAAVGKSAQIGLHT